MAQLTFLEFFNSLPSEHVEYYYIDNTSPEPYVYVNFKHKSFAELFYETQTNVMSGFDRTNEWCYHNHALLALRVIGNLAATYTGKKLNDLHLFLRGRGYRHRHSEEAYLDEFDLLPPAKCFTVSLPTVHNQREVTYEASNLSDAVHVYMAMYNYYVCSFGDKFHDMPCLKNTSVRMIVPVDHDSKNKESRYRFINMHLKANGEETVVFEERTPLQKLMDLQFGQKHERYLPTHRELGALLGSGANLGLSFTYPFEVNEAILSGEMTCTKVRVNERGHDHFSIATFVFFRGEPVYILLNGDDWDNDLFVLNEEVLPTFQTWVESAKLPMKPTYECIDEDTIENILGE